MGIFCRHKYRLVLRVHPDVVGIKYVIKKAESTTSDPPEYHNYKRQHHDSVRIVYSRCMKCGRVELRMSDGSFAKYAMDKEYALLLVEDLLSKDVAELLTSDNKDLRDAGLRLQENGEVKGV